jgi:predicted glutamine amidotransferase
MCLIIQRDPKFILPFEKFESAIINNPDGYGLSYPDQDGKLITLRSADKADPDKLYKLINEELIDQKVMVHLRYTTVGDTILRNAHPFPVLERDVDGIDLRMAHNGTLSKYRPKSNTSTESDTRVFVREFVRPLFKRLARGMDPEELLSDDFTKKLLEDQLSNASVLTFLDGEGNSLICNETGNGGKQEDGWYYSNTYSFNPRHREPIPTTYVTPSSYRNTYPSQGSVTPYTGSKFKDCTVQKFSKKYGLKSITDSFHFSDDVICEIAGKPVDSELLIKELIYSLQACEKDLKVANQKKGR